MIAIPVVKTWLGQPDEEGLTQLLTDLEARAVALVLSETERHFDVAAALTEYRTADGSAKLRLNENATAITSVHERLNPGDTWVEIVEGDSDGFEIRAPRAGDVSGRAILLRKDGLRWRFGFEYRTIYSFGYTAGSEPGQIRQAVLDLVSLKYHQRGREGLLSYRAGDESWVQFSADDVLGVPGLKRTLALWRGRTYA